MFNTFNPFSVLFYYDTTPYFIPPYSFISYPPRLPHTYPLPPSSPLHHPPFSIFTSSSIPPFLLHLLSPSLPPPSLLHPSSYILPPPASHLKPPSYVSPLQYPQPPCLLLHPPSPLHTPSSIWHVKTPNHHTIYDLPLSSGGSKSVCPVWIRSTDNFVHTQG